MATVTVKKKLPFEYRVIKDPTRIGVGEIFKVRHFVCLVVGGPGSGKTMAILNLLMKKGKYEGPYYRKFNRIYWITPSRPDVKVDKTLKLAPERYGSEMDDILPMLEESDGKRRLFVFDDIQPYLKSGNASPLNLLVTSSHHMESAVVVIVHNLSNTPPIIKKSAHVICLSRFLPLAELRSLQPYLKGVTVDEMLAAYRYAGDKNLPLFILQDGTMMAGYDVLDVRNERG